ncbi:MAG TPA: MBL fold metallo-hydrolase, partial [Acidimicrobiales bacterium]|nr:MBL fold metallo-hydrolase [Acidimicrobiales bacterium]
MHIGDIELVPLSDGTCKMPQQFYVGLDFAKHEELLAEDGTVHIPVGCFLLRCADKTVLVDAGLGAVDVGWASGGELPAALLRAGVEPADIDIVVCSHLHIDHIGWLVVDDKPFFPRAVVRYGSADWEEFVAKADSGSRGRHTMELLASQDRLEALEGDMVAIAPGLTGRHTPGHTLGHYGLVVASGDARA